VRKRLASVPVLMIALAGCGGGDGEGGQSSTATPAAPASAQGRAVDDFARAAQAYWDDFRNCGSRLTPTRGFFEACTKRTRHGFQAAEDRVLRELDRSKAAACKRVADRLRGAMARVGAAVERTVVAFDRSNNATLKHRAYRGPPPQQLYLRGAEALETVLPAVRGLSRQIDKGC
jgi:hypothetical protein